MNQDLALGAFQDVDLATSAPAFVSYLDTVSGLPAVQRYKARLAAALGLTLGGRVVDVGCGTAQDACALAPLVGEGGRVVGVDTSETMVATARSRIAGLSLPVEVYQADAHHLPFPDESFDAARSDRAFQHIEDPKRALAEMTRVTRRGSKIVVFDTDWDTLVVHASDRALARRIASFHCDSIRNGDIGRSLVPLFLDQGLHEVDVSAETFVFRDYDAAEAALHVRSAAEQARAGGAISAPEAALWAEHLDDDARRGRFFCAVTGFLVTGKKP